MAITKLQDLIAKVDCPYCFSLLTWDDIQDVQIVNGNKAIICPICGEAIQLDRKKDYWYESISDGGGILTEIDPTVPRWAKQPNKPTYTADQINFVYEQDGQSETIPVDYALNSLIDQINSSANNISTLEQTVNDLSTKIFDQIVINVTDVNTQNQTITISPNDATLLDIANLLRASKSEYIAIKVDEEFYNISNYSVNTSNNQSSDFTLQLSNNYIDYVGASIFYGYLQSSNGELSFSQESSYIPTSSDINNWNSKTSNIGTVTSVAINGSTYQPDSNGSVNLGNISGGSGLQNLVDGVSSGSVRSIHSYNAQLSSEIGIDAIALNYSTKAKGKYSLAEGMITQARGQCSHAEGSGSVAEGINSHAENYGSYAKGDSSHAGGRQFSRALGEGSFTHGYNITANSQDQFVIGTYNQKDTQGTATTRGKYIFIIGNGVSLIGEDQPRYSNAFTVDWSGNTWTQGKMTVGAGPTNNMDVATKQYVDEAIATAIANLNN